MYNEKKSAIKDSIVESSLLIDFVIWSEIFCEGLQTKPLT